MNYLKIPRYIRWLTLTGFIFLVLMTILRLALVIFYKSPAGNNHLLGAFALGLRYDLRMVCIVCMLLFLLGTIQPLHPLDKKWGKRISFWIWTVAIIGFAIFYVVDFANYAYLDQHLTASLLNYLDDAKISMGMVWQTYHVGWIVLILLISIAGLLALIRSTYNITLSKPKSATRKSRITWGIIFFLLLFIGIYGRVLYRPGIYPLRWSDAFELGSDYKASVALNPFQSFFSSLQFQTATYDAAKVRKSYPWVSSYLGVTNPDSSSLNFERDIAEKPKFATQPNIVLVICESFSGYKSSMYGNPLNTTPFFNSLCQKGIFFDRCFTPTYGTARGVWAAITGIPDVELANTSSRNPAYVDQHTIINNFQGYDKLYFIGGSTSWANIRGLLTNNIRGLSLFEQDDYDAPKVDVWGISDKNLFLQANIALSKQKKPFFAVIQTADNHRPYTIPDEDRKEFKRLNIPVDSAKKCGFESVDEYNAFRYTDFCYQKFIEAASKEPYFNNTIFVFVGDHGIRGDAGNMLPRAWTDQGLSAEHVPLLFYAPALIKPQRLSYPASQVDVLPTIAGLCGINYTNTTLGQDLLDSSLITTHNSMTKCDFIIDVGLNRIGTIQNNMFYSYGLNNSSPEQICSIVNNNKIVLTDSLRNHYRTITNAFFETAKYMLANNKKKNGE
ncbi:MAG TPA: sulfatase-like hydrolase/transferase [Chitinophagaceae bacterium]|nr:sulfatase-like hydrolase/transferase [Chitinophagaceae bacterium]